MSPLEIALVVHAGGSSAFALLSAALVLRAPRAAPPLAYPPPVVVLRPRETEDLAGGSHIVEDADAYAGRIVSIACSAPRGALRANRKVENLAAGLAAARARGLVGPDTIVVQADADVLVAPGDLDALVATLLRDSPDGAAIAVPAPSGAGFAARVASAMLTASPHAFASLARLATLIGGPPRIAGKLVAFRARTLDAIGGYARLASRIGDDLALGEALRARGTPIAVSPIAVRTRARAGMGALAAQLVRWLRVLGAHGPALLVAYPTLLAPLAVALALSIACALAGAPGLAAGTLGCALVARVALAAALRARAYRGRSDVSLLVVPLAAIVGDALLTVAALLALRRTVAWAGYLYRLGARGTIARRDALVRASHSR